MAGRMISALRLAPKPTVAGAGFRAARGTHAMASDTEFVRLALMSRSLGFNVALLMESPRGLACFTRADALGVPAAGHSHRLTRR